VFSWFKKRIVLSICGALILLYVLFELVTQVFVFCRDAYVTTDIVFVAPQVSGPIAKLPISDNQKIEAGSVLFIIDPEPFELALHTEQAALDLARADLKKVQDQVGLVTSEIEAKQAILDDAQRTRDRIVELSKGGEVSRLTMDDAQKTFEVALAGLNQAKSSRLVAIQEVAVQTAVIYQAETHVAKANYDLQRTVIYAPVSGWIAPLRVRRGQYVETGVLALAIVSNQNWRVVANLPERHLAGLSIGQKVWFMIGSDPWRVHVGTVKSIAPGVARSPQALEPLPYISPTTDWIRLARRFPVEINIGDLPKQKQLFQGADATIWMVK
jgi:membrane fusion protein, multidrug efflux system